jgi:hypothetical protein
MTVPIYTRLEIPFFTNELLKKLTPHALAAHDAKAYQWYPPGGIGLAYLKDGLYDLVSEFTDDIMVDWRQPPTFAITSPNTWLHKHIDSFGIYSKILIPILPEKDFQPCPFYHSTGIVEPVSMELYKPILIDTYTEHGGYTTNNNVRATLQFTFNIRIEEMISAIKEKRFTRTLECNIL